MILGYILGKSVVSGKLRGALYAAGILSFIVCPLFVMQNLRDGKAVWLNGGYTVNHYLEAAALFLFCKNTVRRTDAFVSRLSALSMDTYFIHVFVLENVKRISVDVRPSAKILLWISITVLLSFLWAFLKTAAVRFVKKRMAARGSTKE